jgi:hypothetical protein
VILLIAGQQSPTIKFMAAFLAGLALLVLVGALALAFFRRYERWAKSALERAYEGLHVHSVAEHGDVVLDYHTYHGIIAWTTETPHRVIMPGDDARELLSRLLRFNLTWGLVAHGGILVPPLAIANYYAQRRSLEHQLIAAVSGRKLARTKRPSLFRLIFGSLMLFLAAVFAVAAVALLAERKFDGGMGGAFLAVLLAWAGRDWLRKRS